MLELSIPKPVFIRLGFSNSPLLAALYCGFTLPEFAYLTLLKILLQGIINGTLFSYAFVLSAAGGLSSAAAMYIVYRAFSGSSRGLHRGAGQETKSGGKRTIFPEFSISMITVSEVGAFVSNTVQIFVSRFFLGPGVYALSPVILGFGIVSSFVLGLLTQLFCSNSEFLKTIQEPSFFAAFLPKPAKPMTQKTKTDRLVKILVSSTCLVTCFFTENVTLSGVMSFFLLIACLSTKRKIRVWPVAWTIFRTVAISLFVPAGRVLFSLGRLAVTQDSIFLGLHRSFVILSTTFYSRLLVPKPNEVESAFKPGSVMYLSMDYFKEVSELWYKRLEKNIYKRIDNTLLTAVKRSSNLF